MKQEIQVVVTVHLEAWEHDDNVTLFDIRNMVDAAICAIGSQLPLGSYIITGTWTKKE
jgi:hypothetical protein